MKKRMTVLILIMFVFLLTGCGSISVETNTKINKSGGGTFTQKIVADGIFAQEEGSYNDQYKEVFEKYKSSIKVENKKENDKIISQFTYTFKNLNDLNKFSKDLGENQFDVSLQKKDGFFYTTYIYNAKLPKNMSMDEAMKEVKTQGGSDNLGYSQEDIIKFIGQAIKYKNSITLPSRPTKTNGTITGNTVTWEFALSDIKPNTQMTLEYQALNVVNIAILSGIGIILIGGIIFIIIKKKNNDEGKFNPANFQG